jgi:chaperone required for assembly of F1-ATPase
MDDVFEQIFVPEPLDPAAAARRNMRALKRRFYAGAEVRPDPAGAAIALDGRPIRTPARRALAAPTRPLAEAIAEEWRAQKEFIDPATMPLTRLANTIIDGVAAAPDEVAREIANYLGSDLVCYRATNPERLAARQALLWDPILAWARDALGAQFEVRQGVMHAAQPNEAIAAARTQIPHHPWRLGAVHAITTLTGSPLIALAVATGAIGRDAAWAAAHIDEDWNMERWGRDEGALKRRAYRFAEMTAATRVLEEMTAPRGEGRPETASVSPALSFAPEQTAEATPRNPQIP